MNTPLSRLFAAACLVSLAASALAYVPKQDIKIERDGVTAFKVTGKNTFGDVNVEINDKHLFSGFKAEGKNGDRKVEIDIRSAGLGSGWKIEGKIGTDRVDVRCKQKGPFQDWKVEGKVGERRIEAEVEDDWGIDPAAASILVILDCCDDAKPQQPANPGGNANPPRRDDAPKDGSGGDQGAKPKR